MELRGRVSLVTGAGAGIGRAGALALAREGASVVAVDLDEPAAAETVRLAGGGMATRADVADDDELRAAFAAAGPLDVLVNNAGGGTSRYEFENAVQPLCANRSAVGSSDSFEPECQPPP